MFNEINAFQGLTDLFASLESDIPGKRLEILKGKIGDFFNLKNVNFLIGSGASNGAIDTMKDLLDNLRFGGNETEEQKKFDEIKSIVGEDLEAILSVLYSGKWYFEVVKKTNEGEDSDVCVKLISKIEKHIFDSIHVNFEDEEVKTVLERYKKFYQKLSLRSRDLSRIRIFTTNNDLMNETALDALNIHYINGFSGGLRKFFNPALFNYTWSKRMDTGIDKYEPVENLVYLYKLHGSINWHETESLDNNYFEIEELPPCEIEREKAMLIYPTPTKQDKSLGSPYVDLFREFQNKLLEPHSVLFIIGYGFNDRHVNDIIYRALATNSTINVVIFGRKPEKSEREKKPIFFIDDNRIFTIYGKVEEQDNSGTSQERIVNHFDYIVDVLLPNLDAFHKEDNMIDFIKRLRENHEDR